MHAQEEKLHALPDETIFDFIMELDKRLRGFPLLRKELSYYGAIRCNPAEVEDALSNQKLAMYRVDITTKKGIVWCRVNKDA